MGRFRFLAGWLVATAIAMALAFGAVSIVAGDISEGPRELASASTPAPSVDPAGVTTTTVVETAPSTSSMQGQSSTTTVSDEGPTTTEDEPAPSTTEAQAPSTTESDDDDAPTSSSSSTSSTSSTSSSSSTSSTSSSTTSSVPSTVVIQTVSYDGNWVRFSCAADVAAVQAFGVGTGYRLAEAPQLSGQEGKVEFESTDGTVEVDFRVRCEDGQIETWSEVD